MLSENAQQRLPNSFAPVIIIFGIKQKSNTSDEKSRRATLPGAIAMAWWISCTGKTKNAEPTGDSIARENSHKRLSISSASTTSIPDPITKSNPSEEKILPIVDLPFRIRPTPRRPRREAPSGRSRRGRRRTSSGTESCSRMRSARSARW